MGKLYDVEVTNRFTGRLIKVYYNKSITGVYSIQDKHLLEFWIKIEMFERIKMGGVKDNE